MPLGSIFGDAAPRTLPTKFDVGKALASGKLTQEQIDAHLKENPNIVPINTPIRKPTLGDVGYRPIKDTARTLADVGIGALKSIPGTIEGATRLMGQGFNAISAPIVSAVTGKKQPSDYVNPINEGLASISQPSNSAQSVGKFLGDVGQFFIPGAAATKAGTVAEKLPMLSKASPFLQKIAGKAAQGLVTGGADAGINAAQQGKIDKNTALIGGLGAASPILGSAAAFPFKSARGAIGEAAVGTTLTQAGKDAARGFDVGQAATDFILPSLSRKGLQKKVATKISGVSRTLDSMIAEAASSGKGAKSAQELTRNIDDLIKKAEPDLLSGLGVEERKGVFAKMNDKIQGFIMDNPKTLDLTSQQVAKKKLGSRLGNILESDKVLRAGEAANAAIRKSLQSSIEKSVPGAKEANSILAPLLRANRRLLAKGERKGLWAPAYDVLAGTFWSQKQGSSITENPVDFAKNFLIGALIRRAAGTTLGKTSAASLLRLGEKTLQSPIPTALTSEITKN